MSLW
ncbi:hypothetical protein VCHC65A1_03370A, partial [Vibrio cholerae HC-65A1]|jgi:hypothetical protein